MNNLKEMNAPSELLIENVVPCNYLIHHVQGNYLIHRELNSYEDIPLDNGVYVYKGKAYQACVVTCQTENEAIDAIKGYWKTLKRLVLTKQKQQQYSI